MVTCDICLKRFKRKDYLLIHMNIHTGNGKLKINLLLITYSLISGNGVVKCDICCKQYASKKYIMTHMKTHSSKSSLFYS